MQVIRNTYETFVFPSGYDEGVSSAAGIKGQLVWGPPSTRDIMPRNAISNAPLHKLHGEVVIKQILHTGTLILGRIAWIRGNFPVWRGKENIYDVAMWMGARWLLRQGGCQPLVPPLRTASHLNTQSHNKILGLWIHLTFMILLAVGKYMWGRLANVS